MVTSARPLTVEEERVRGNVFDIDLLAGRLLDVTAGLQAMPDVLAAYRLLRSEHRCRGRPVAAADSDADIAAIVSCAGRPDHAGENWSWSVP